MCIWGGYGKESYVGRATCRVDIFFFQAEDGIRDSQESRVLGDVYKRQVEKYGLSYYFEPDKDNIACCRLKVTIKTGKAHE